VKPLALTVLVHEGPMARAYLGMLRAAGFRVERLVLMLQKRDPGSQRLLPPWLPAALRRPLSRKVQDLRMNHWPRELLRRHNTVCAPWLKALATTYAFDPVVFDSLTERPNYARYADKIDEVLTDGLTDPALAHHLEALPGRAAVLFTGGGMVPAALLALPRCRFIHIHPGVLPQVRGADGLLWSLLLRGRPGATAFYMSPGLDSGDVIATGEFVLPPLPEGFTAFDPRTAYRLLYSFVDPVLRALMLLRVLQLGDSDLFMLPRIRQESNDGTTFHFMNDAVRRFSFERLQNLSDRGRT